MRKNLILILTFLAVACNPGSNYTDLSEVKAWENDIRKFEEADSLEQYPDDAILFAGSSSIRLWTTIKQDMAPYPVIQRGFGGSHLVDMVAYGERIISKHKCRAIVLFIANDITGTVEDKSPAEVASLFKHVLGIIRKSHPETPVFWVEVTPTPLRWKVWPEIQESTRLIRRICGKNDNTYAIRTDFGFLNEKGEPKQELFVADSLHLNAEGYAVWNKIIKEQLKKVLQH